MPHLRLTLVASFTSAIVTSAIVTSAPITPRIVAVARGQDPTPRTLLGIVSEAGIVTPIVRFDGARWRNRWPAPDPQIADMPLPSSLGSVPVAWTAVPIPARWYAWPRETTTARTIQVTAPVRYDAHCLPGFGLQSDLRSPEPLTRARSFPKKKLAVAVSHADVRIDPVTELNVHSPAERDLLRTAEPFFRARAGEAARKEDRAVPSSRVPVRWTKAWRYTAPDSDEHVYLLEGRLGDDRDDAVPFLTGFLWLRTRNGTPAGERGAAVVDEVDYKRTRFHEPLGVVVLGAGRFWVSEVGGYEHEEYELTEISAPTFRTALTMAGGGC